MEQRSKIISATSKFTLQDWAVLWMTYARSERTYREMGRDGAKKWLQLKILFWLYAYQVPIRVGAMLEELGVKEEEFVEQIDAMTALKWILPIGYHQGVAVPNMKVQQVMELTNVGRLEVIRKLDHHKLLLDKELAAIAGWRGAGHFG